MTNETKAFTVRIPAVVYQAIAERAKNEGRSLSYMVSSARSLALMTPRMITKRFCLRQLIPGQI